MPPLGILYLASWLRKHGHEPSIVDLAGKDNWREALKDKKIEEASWTGISATTPQYPTAKEITAQIKTAYGKDKKVVVGGIHTTSLVHANELDFLEKDGFDSYVIGEGYGSVVSICRDLASGPQGNNGALKRLYQEPILKDVNTLPFAARDLIDIKSYKYKLGDKLCTTQYSQYGCPYACQYCESPMAGSWTVRAMHPDRVAAEVQQCIDDFGIYADMFFDDEMNLNKQRMLGICERLERIEEVSWRGFFVTAKFDQQIAEACKRSNCYEVAAGIESGSETVLRAIKKPATREINKRFVITAKKAGLRVKLFLIVGLPKESWETVRETDQFLEELRAEGCAPDDIDVSLLQIYPGSPLRSNPQDVEFDSYENFDKMFYKSSPSSYESLIQVRTSSMSKMDLISARNYLENKWKKPGWVKDHTDRKDLDRITETIKHAEKQLVNA